MTQTLIPRAGSILSLTLLVLGLAACAGTPAAEPSDDPVVAEEPAPSRESEDTPTPTPEPAPVTVLSHSWTDSDGYSFSLSVDTAETTASSDIANAKPGEAEILFSVNASGAVANTTPSRNAEAPRAMGLIPVWPASSTACKYLFQATGGHEDWCMVSSTNQTGLYFFPEDGKLNEGASTRVNITQGAPIEFTVDEADSDAVVSELAAPAGWMLTLMDTEKPLGDCLAYWNSRDVAASTVSLECAG